MVGTLKAPDSPAHVTQKKGLFTKRKQNRVNIGTIRDSEQYYPFESKTCC